MELLKSGADRRSFVKKLGLAGLAGTLVPSFARAQSPITDVDIVNFALNLEYLEGEFYSVATTGMTLAQRGFHFGGPGSGVTTGGAKVPFVSDTDVFTEMVAYELGLDELEHISFLRTTLNGLGATPVAKPAINLDALGVGFASVSEFLTLGRDFEDVGVTAYGGVAPLSSSSTILGYAARILATEAEHAGNLRLQIAHYAIPTTPLDGVDIIPPPSGKKFFSNDSNALTETRTPGQVLNIVYGGVANATSGGFFPNGVNGTINMSSAPA